MPRRLRLTTQIRSAQAAAGGDLDDETLAKIAQSSVHSSPGGTPAPLKRRRQHRAASEGKVGEADEDGVAFVASTRAHSGPGRRSSVSVDGGVSASATRLALAASADMTSAEELAPPETDYTRQVEPGLVPLPASATASHPDGSSSGPSAPQETVTRATFGAGRRSSHASGSPMLLTRSRDITEPATPAVLPHSSGGLGLGVTTRLRGAAAPRSTPAARAARTLAAAAVHSSRAAAALGRAGEGDGGVSSDPPPSTGAGALAADDTPVGAALEPRSAAEEAPVPIGAAASAFAAVAPAVLAPSPVRATPLAEAVGAFAALPLPASLALPVPPTLSDAVPAAPTPHGVSASQNASAKAGYNPPALPLSPPFFTVVAAQHQANVVCEDRWFSKYDDTVVSHGAEGSGPVVVGVCDGHGGAEAAAWVAEFLPMLILSHTRSKHTAADVSAAISAAFLHADRDFRKIVITKAQRSTGADYSRAIMHGTCVVATLFRQIDGLWWAFYANCGDCRAISGSLRPASRGRAPGAISDPVQRRLLHPSARLPVHSRRSETVSDDYRACAAAIAQSIVPGHSETASPAAEHADPLSPVTLVARALAERTAAQLLSPTPSSAATHNAMWAAPERSLDHSATWNVREIRGVHLRCKDPLPVRLSPRQPAGDGGEHAAVSKAFAEARRAWEAERLAVRGSRASNIVAAAGIRGAEEAAEAFAPSRPRASAAASDVPVPRRSSPRVEQRLSRLPSSPTTVYRWMLLRGSHAAQTPQEPVLPTDLQRSLRVAGSLTVTRALGDFYVKDPQLSFPLLGPHCPYISAAPDVYATPLTSSDRFVVLACDGIFDETSSSQAVQLVAEALEDCERARGSLPPAKSSSPAVKVFNNTQELDGLLSVCEDGATAPSREQEQALESLMLGQDVRVSFPLSRGVGLRHGAGAAAAAASSQAFVGLTPQWRGPSPGAVTSQPWSQPSYSQQSAESGVERGDRVPPIDVGGLVAAFAGSPAHRLVGHALHCTAKTLASTTGSSVGSISEALGVIMRAPVGVGRPNDATRCRRSMHDDLTAVVITLPSHLFPAPGPLVPAATFLEDPAVAEVSSVMDAVSALSDCATAVESVVIRASDELSVPLQFNPREFEGSQKLPPLDGTTRNTCAPGLPKPDLPTAEPAVAVDAADEPELLHLPGTAPVLATLPPVPPLETRPQRLQPPNTMLSYFKRSNRTPVTDVPTSDALVTAEDHNSAVVGLPQPALPVATAEPAQSSQLQAEDRLADLHASSAPPVPVAGSALGEARGVRSAIAQLPTELDDVIEGSDDEPERAATPGAVVMSSVSAVRLASQRPFAASASQVFSRGGAARIGAAGAKRSRAELLLNRRGGAGEGVPAMPVARTPLMQRSGFSDAFLSGGAAGRPAH